MQDSPGVVCQPSTDVVTTRRGILSAHDGQSLYSISTKSLMSIVHHTIGHTCVRGSFGEVTASRCKGAPRKDRVLQTKLNTTQHTTNIWSMTLLSACGTHSGCVLTPGSFSMLRCVPHSSLHPGIDESTLTEGSVRPHVATTMGIIAGLLVQNGASRIHA
jgi:hypothetical protein